MRATIVGTRSVVMIDSMQLSSHMARKGFQGKISMAPMTTFLQAMNLPALGDYCKQCTLWSGTVGSGGLLYTPYGSIMAEMVQTCTIILRLGVLFGNPSDPEAYNKAKHRASELAVQPPNLPAPAETKWKAERMLCEAIVAVLEKKEVI